LVEEEEKEVPIKTDQYLSKDFIIVYRHPPLPAPNSNISSNFTSYSPTTHNLITTQHLPYN
jgi:hypothetical protein